MKDIKVYIKMIKYGTQFKLMCILTLFFFIIGILFEVLDSSSSTMGAVYLSLSGLYIFQLLFTTSIAKVIQTSPYKKKIQVNGTTILSLIMCLFTFSILVVIRLLKWDPEYYADQGINANFYFSSILFAAIVIAFLLFYMAFSFKMYMAALVICIMFVVGFMMTSMKESTSPFVRLADLFMNGDDPTVLIICSYGIVLLGGLLCYIASSLLYRKELSGMAIRSALRQSWSK